ncbi:MAG: hypothetical protein IKW59_01070 [Clostridia bacterium]|nr:hypothetical protein [Clostridia bacterium]
MKNIEFTKGNWENYFEYAYTTRFPFTPKFVQEEDCISNGRNPRMSDGFDYTTIMTKEKFGAGTKLWATCSFEKYGAPLITLTDKLKKDENGDLRYDACYEFVLWDKGLNVWDLFIKDSELKWEKMLSVDFSLACNEKHEIYIEILEKGARVVIGDKDIYLRIENLPENVYIGVTGCENINRIYNLKIDDNN